LANNSNKYPKAGKNAPPGVRAEIFKFRSLSASSRAESPLLYHLLGSGTPSYKMSKDDAEYTDRSEFKQNCSNCEFLYKKIKTGKFICSQIAGHVKPKGLCRLWV